MLVKQSIPLSKKLQKCKYKKFWSTGGGGLGGCKLIRWTVDRFGRSLKVQPYIKGWIDYVDLTMYKKQLEISQFELQLMLM